MPTYWTTRDGRRLDIETMDDTHIINALRMGLRAHFRRTHCKALNNLAIAYSGDGGAAYIGDVQYALDLAQTTHPSYLRSQLVLSPRYAPLLQEANRRGLRLSRMSRAAS